MTKGHKTSLLLGENSTTNPQDGCSTFPNPSFSKEEETKTSQEKAKAAPAAAKSAETEDPSYLDLLAPPSLFDSYSLTLWANSFLTSPTSSFNAVEETEDPSVRMNMLISSPSSSRCISGYGGSAGTDDEDKSSSSSLEPEMKNHRRHHHGQHRRHPSVGLPSGYPALHRNTSYPPDDFDDLEDDFLDRYSHVSITDNKGRPHPNNGHQHHSQEESLLVSNKLLHLQDIPSLYSVRTATNHHVTSENDSSPKKRTLKDTHHPHHNKRQRRSHYALGAKDFYDQILIKVFDNETNDFNVKVSTATTCMT